MNAGSPSIRAPAKHRNSRRNFPLANVTLASHASAEIGTLKDTATMPTIVATPKADSLFTTRLMEADGLSIRNGT